MKKIHKSEQEWKAQLSAEEYHVLREKGTERPFSGEYVDFDDDGNYVCAACGNVLFTSDTKFESGCGWPSFDQYANNDSVELHPDSSFGMQRIEVTCKKCGGHLGHVFDDGPTDTGKRFCINSVAIKFKKK